MAPNPRVVSAFRAMEAMGISRAKVKPVLKKLLRLYDKNWELIEEESYRALLDAIFDEEDNKEEQPEANDEPERPLKRLRRGGHEALSNSNCGSPSAGLITPKVEEQELPGSISLQPLPGLRKSQSESISSQNHAGNRGKQPLSAVPLAAQRSSNQYELHGIDRNLPSDAFSPERRVVDKGKETFAPLAAPKETRSNMGGTLHIDDSVSDSGIILLPKQKVPDTCILMKPKDEPFTDDMPLNEIPHYELPIAVIHPDSSPGKDSSSPRSVGQETQASSFIAREGQSENGSASSREALANSVLSSVPEESPTNLEIATSPMGEVKISLSCNSILGRPNFRMPTQDELLKSMEEKCLRSYKILDPNFSFKKMMKDMCDCFLELATDSSHESQERLMNVTPCIDLLKKSPARNALGVGGIANCVPVSASNGSVDVHCNSGLDNFASNKEVSAGSSSKKGLGSREPQSSSLAVVPQRELSAEELWSLHNLSDMTKGEEMVQIPWLNEVNSLYPPSFNYIPRNLIFQNAHVNFTLSQIRAEDCCSTCFGDCLTSSTPCVCTDETGHVFQYTSEGLLVEEFLEDCIAVTRDPLRQEFSYCIDCPVERAKNDEVLEPCKGHVKRKFLKECWSKCGCHKQCGNRVVQRGIRCNLQVFFTSNEKGWGLRTLEKLPKGAFVCEYVGEILTAKELFQRINRKTRNTNSVRNAYPVMLDSNWTMKAGVKDEEALCLDATFFGNVCRFINHRCLDANLIEIPVKIETPDHHYYHLAFFTTREVNAFEELTWDYGIDFDDNDNPFNSFHCHCGGKFCRNMKRSYRSKSAARKN